MDWGSLITAAIASFGAPTVAILFIGGLGLWFMRQSKPPTAQGDMARQLVEFQNSVMKRLADLEQQNSELRAEVIALNERLNVKDLEIQRLRYDLALMESAHQDLPIPMWLKDENGTMLACNRSYEELFLLPMGKTRADYIGYSDFDVWPEDVAKTFIANDIEVYRNGKIFNSTERFPVDGIITDYHVIKYPRYAGGQKIGIAGIAIPPISSLMRLQ